MNYEYSCIYERLVNAKIHRMYIIAEFYLSESKRVYTIETHWFFSITCEIIILHTKINEKLNSTLTLTVNGYK